MSFDNFAEGDSGVVMSPVIAQWNRLQAQKNERQIVGLKADELQAEILELARDKRGRGEARVAAYELVWKIGLYRAKAEGGGDD